MSNATLAPRKRLSTATSDRVADAIEAVVNREQLARDLPSAIEADTAEEKAIADERAEAERLVEEHEYHRLIVRREKARQAAERFSFTPSSRADGVRKALIEGLNDEEREALAALESDLLVTRSNLYGAKSGYSAAAKRIAELKDALPGDCAVAADVCGAIKEFRKKFKIPESPKATAASDWSN